jgi:hypothetical protein
MHKKTLLIVLFFIALLMANANANAQPPPPTVHQFKVRYTCQGSNDAREVLVETDSAEDARSIIEDMIPCVVIIKITEVLLYTESLRNERRL